MQLAFDGEMPTEISETVNILHTENIGRVHMIIVKGDGDEIRQTIKRYNPVICDILPLTLEEVFIYELGGLGYEFESIII